MPGISSPSGSGSWWKNWWLHRLPVTDVLQLTHRNAYILPSRAGLVLAATLLVLLLTSINDQLNLGYLLTFMLAGSALASMPMAHANLRGLNLHLQTPPPCQCGTSVRLQIRLKNPGRQPRHAIALGLLGKDALVRCDLAAQDEHTVELLVHMPQRGRHALPPLALESRFPLGLFRVWAVWRCASPIIVYPQPETAAPALPLDQADPWGSGLQQAPDPLALEGVRPYQRGDARKQIVWKKTAKTDELVSRDASSPQARGQLWLDLTQTGEDALEQGLSRLCAWVLEAERRQLRYGLRLPGLQIAPAQGPAHQQQCLEALALC